MTISSIEDIFVHESEQEKVEFLLELAHAMTIIARDSYEVDGEGLTDQQRLRRINEIQHRITGHLLALARPDTPRYPDDVLIRIIFDQADDPGLRRQLFEIADRFLAPTPAAP